MTFILLAILSTNVIFGQQEAAKKSADSTVVVVYYFHGQYRCITCTNMEKWAKEVVETKFKNEVKQGIVKFKAINYELEKNWPFFDKYMLTNKHIILSRIESGEEKSWKDLKRIWEIEQEKALFQAYVEKELKNFLNKKDETSQQKKEL